MRNLERLAGDPPLRSVRAFEAIARLGTVTAAAAELSVSPSAISHQLQLLERFLGVALTQREGRGLALTDAGRDYYRSVRSVFSVLRGATDQLRERNGLMDVHLSVIPLFATGWLIPHLPEFIALHPEFEVNITYANHQNYHSDSSDLSVRFGRGQWNGYESARIMSGAVTPICHSSFLSRIDMPNLPEALMSVPLIHDQDRALWLQWFQMHGMAVPNRLGGHLLEDGLLARSATEAGIGVALLRPALLKPALDCGDLVRLSEKCLDDGRHYYVCHRAGVALTPPELAMRAWLLGHDH